MSFTLEQITENGVGIVEYLDQFSERVNLINVTVRLSVDLTDTYGVENEFVIKPGIGRIYRTSTRKELYQICAAETVNGRVIQVQPQTTLAKHYIQLMGD